MTTTTFYKIAIAVLTCLLFACDEDEFVGTSEVVCEQAGDWREDQVPPELGTKAPRMDESSIPLQLTAECESYEGLGSIEQVQASPREDWSAERLAIMHGLTKFAGGNMTSRIFAKWHDGYVCLLD